MSKTNMSAGKNRVAPSFGDIARMQKAVSAIIPWLAMLDTIPGYEKAGAPGEPTEIPPPEKQEDIEEEKKNFPEIPKVTDSEAKEILRRYGKRESCCYGTDFINYLDFTLLEHSVAWHYKLESFFESRSTCWEFVPFEDQEVDGGNATNVPKPWDLSVKPDALFRTHQKEISVPHTSSVKPCHQCEERKTMPCNKCKGHGKNKCAACDGSKRKSVATAGIARRIDCRECHGSGTQKCLPCSGNGEIACTACNGCGKLLFSIKVKIEWTTRAKEFIEENTDLPDHLVKNVRGSVILKEEKEWVSPITNFPHSKVNEVSKQLMAEHREMQKRERIVHQRHLLRLVPVTECHYDYGLRKEVFFVYGFENKIYLEDYPEKGCSSCNII